MTNIPEGAEYYYKHTYYRIGDVYAMYYQNGWRESATLLNEKLELEGVPINVKPLPDTAD